MMKGALTTGQVAEHCGVNYQTVVRWIKSGRLAAHRLPGRGDHRVEPREFVRFMESAGLPLPEGYAAGPRRVLIVDDDRAMARSLARPLARAGYEAHTASNGFEAGAEAIVLRPRVITLDLKMPGLDGYAVIRYVREHPSIRDVKVLVVSAAGRDAIDRAVRGGADASLQKPVDSARLVDVVDGLLRPKAA